MNSQPAPQRKLTKEQGLERLAECREDLAMILAGTFATQQQVHRMIGITGDLWRAIGGEEAPEIEVTPIVRRLRDRMSA